MLLTCLRSIIFRLVSSVIAMAKWSRNLLHTLQLSYFLPSVSKQKLRHCGFQEVMTSEEFLLLPVGQLCDIISSDELNVRSEEQVFSAVMAWVKFSVSERRAYLPQVLQHVRLPLLNPKFLVGTVGSDLLIKSDEACRDLVDEAKNYLLLPQERPLMQGPRTKPRKPIRRGEVLFAGTGHCANLIVSYLNVSLTIFLLVN